MKVLIIRSNPVDPDPRVEKEASALLKSGYDVSILAWDRSEDYPIRKTHIIFDSIITDIYRVGIHSSYGDGIRNIKNLVKFQCAIRRFLKNNSFDVVHACDFDTAFMAYHSINHKKTKFVYDIFDYYVDAFAVPPMLKKAVEYIDKKLIDAADFTIICSEERMEQIKGTNPKKIVIIHNSPREIFDDTSYNEQPETHGGEVLKLAYFGILAKGRLIKELIDTIKSDSSYELHIGGFGQYENYVLAASVKYNNIQYYGKIAYKEVLELEQKCDVMFAAYDPNVKNHRYAAPNKFYEALMLGKPLIMAKNTGMSNIVQEKDIGVLIDYSPNGIKSGLEEMLVKIKEKEEIKTKMKSLYKDKYSWAEMEKRLISAYVELGREQ